MQGENKWSLFIKPGYRKFYQDEWMNETSCLSSGKDGVSDLLSAFLQEKTIFG